MFGMPYLGSKNKIARKIIDILPSAEYFYDCFGGGGAITHCAFLSNKFKKIIYNELNPLIFKSFQMALNGDFKKDQRWISRDDYKKSAKTDPYVNLCFSFGSKINGGYCYSKEIEEYKKALHYFIVFDDDSLFKDLFKTDFKFTKTDLKERRLEIQKFLKSLGFKESIYRNHNLENLDRVNEISKLKNIELLNTSYENIKFKENSVIYCDPPYKETTGYKSDFDHNKFYEWARKQNNIFISEYQMPDDFKEILRIEKRVFVDTQKSKTAIEKLFINTNKKEFLNDFK